MSDQPLKELRLERDLTRSAVAAQLDMSERHLLRLETGQTRLTRANALMFADYYGVTLAETGYQNNGTGVAA